MRLLIAVLPFLLTLTPCRALAGSPFIWGANSNGSEAVSLANQICFSSGECITKQDVPVSSVGATSPVQSSGGSSPVISMPASTSGSDGYLTSGDWSTFNAKPSAASVWGLSGNAGAGGSILGTTDAVDLTIRTNGFNQMVMSQDGGWQSNQSFDVPDSTSKVQYYLSSALTPTVDAPASNRSSLGVNLEYDTANAGHDLGGSLQAQTIRLNTGGSGVVNYGSVLDASYDLRGGGTLNQFRGINLDGYLAPGNTVDTFTGVRSNLYTAGSTVNGLNNSESNAYLQDVTGGNLVGYNTNIGVVGNSTVAQAVTGQNVNAYIRDNTTINGQLQGVSLFTGAANNSRAQSVNGVFTNVVIEDTASVGGVNAMPINLDVKGSANGGGINTLSVNTQIRENATALGVFGFNLGSNITDNAVLQNYSGANINSNISGNAVVDNVTMAYLGGNVEGNALLQNLSGVQSSVTMSGTSSTGSLTAAQFNANVNDTATVANGITGLRVTVNTATPQKQIEGLSVSVDNASLDPVVAAAGGQVMAISANGGSMSINSNYNPPATVGFFQNHYIGGGSTVLPGAPISAYGFGTNLAQSIDFQDDWSPDFTGLRLGYVDVGFVGSISGATGKTMDSWTGALGGFGNPSGGSGVIDQAIMFRAAGGLPQGGSLSVTNMYGFQAMPTLCAIGTNCWAFYDDSGTENYLGKLAIGTASKKAATGVALDVVGRAAFTEGVQLTTSGSQPSCDVGHRGLMWNIEGGAGVADILQVCQKTVLDTYLWVTK